MHFSITWGRMHGNAKNQAGSKLSGHPSPHSLSTLTPRRMFSDYQDCYQTCRPGHYWGRKMGHERKFNKETVEPPGPWTRYDLQIVFKMNLMFFPSGACHSGCQSPDHFYFLLYLAISNTYVTSLIPGIHRKSQEPQETDCPCQPCWRITRHWQKRQGAWVVETMMSLGGMFEPLIDGT